MWLSYQIHLDIAARHKLRSYLEILSFCGILIDVKNLRFKMVLPERIADFNLDFVGSVFGVCVLHEFRVKHLQLKT